MNFKKTKALFSLVRFPNLIIISITLSLLYYNAKAQSIPKFSFVILCLGTICVAAAGNIINDIVDIEIDLINKKSRVVLGRSISIQAAWKLYFCLNLLAIGGAVCLRSLDLFFFFFLAILLLYVYSTLWKRQAFIGNLVVAFLCAWVVIEFWWFSYHSLTSYWHGILMAYTLFAFLSTLVRELVKDLEDLEGDKLQGCQTLAIQKGTTFVKKVVFLFVSLLGVLLIVEACFFYVNTAYSAFIYLIIALIVPLFYLIKIVRNAKLASDFGQISRLLKAYMLLGLLLLFWV